MLRGFLDSLLLFCVPFAAYAAYLIVRTRLPPTTKAWGRAPVLRLVIAGLFLAVLGTLLGGVLVPRRTGSYVPAHIEKGVLVPGRLD